jgi:molecular chaperone GrpE
MAEDEKILKEQTTEPEAEASAGEEINEEAADTAGAAETAQAGEADAPEETEETADAEETAEEDDAGKDAAKPDKKDRQIEELNDKYRRLFAEFDNYRKRTEVEKAAMFDEGERAVLLRVLPLMDNFERALGSVPEEEKGSAFAEGIEKIYRAFSDQLKEMGVTEIEAVGKPFDANLHNAVMHIEDESLDENVVADEFQKGYMFRDRVLRYSMVKVAN